MKTLDEVIEAQERCGTYPNCHFCYLHSGPMCEWIQDALHYLREYRELLTNCKQFKNDPLTWDELKQMEGKPVWVEERMIIDGKEKTAKEWMILRKAYKGVVHLDAEEGEIVRDIDPKTWQAYRKERE